MSLVGNPEGSPWSWKKRDSFLESISLRSQSASYESCYLAIKQSLLAKDDSSQIAMWAALRTPTKETPFAGLLVSDGFCPIA